MIDKPLRLAVFGLGAVLIGVLPLISLELSLTMAEAAGCVVNAAGVHPCVIAGMDWGSLLYTMQIMAWLTLVSFWLIPPGLLLILMGLFGWVWARR